VMNNVLYFAASSSAGMQLWSSNGTSSGTTMLTDVNPKYGGIDPADLTVVGNTLYFEADNGAAGPQLWSSNGTSSGTQMVTDVDAPIGLMPSYLTNVSGTLYFVGYNPTDAYQLYTSNGTSSGTVMVADINGTSGCNPSDLTAVGSDVYFSATDGVHGQQLWVSNGTATGTTMVDEIDGSVGSFPDEITANGSSAYFAAFDSTHGYQLWVSNGTSSGTTMLTSANTSGGGVLPSNLTVAGGTLFFRANDGAHGYQLWSSNGTASGTAMVADINGDAGADPSYLTAIGGTVYFSATNGTDSYQLWSSNGTASGTAMVDDINGTAGSDPASLTDMGGMLYFSAYTSKTGFQVWQSSGSASGTTMDSDLNAPTGCSPTNLAAASSDLYFTGAGAPLWQWQSTSAVTPTITWANPANITYGTPLGSTQLDATASYTSNGTMVNVPGTFAYTPASGTVLHAGNSQKLSVVFTPTNTSQYTTASASVSINVLEATPTITWANPANIVYGTALGSAQLDATAAWTVGGTSGNVSGTFVYSPAAGTVLHAGNNQSLSVSFTPTDTTDYTTASAKAVINVLQATPTITWANPANIVYGTALGTTQLDATASVAGTFAYTPAAGTVLHAGNSQALSVGFTPTDTTDYATASATVSINVLQATPKIAWANPANIVYGTALGAAQLDATASVSGTLTYTPAAGTVPHAGNGQELSVSFTPTDTTDYAAASGSATINVLQATPTITWPNPSSIAYGTPLGSTQLDATASWTVGGTSGAVAGTFTYTPPAGTVLNVGNNQVLSVSFAPSDTTDYTTASGSAVINVVQSTTTISWANPANIIYGTALGATQLDATANVPGTFTYTPAAGTVLHAGNGQILSVSFTPTNTAEYPPANATVSINVLQATPTIMWANPANIVYGTALGSTQLDATASWTVGGTSSAVIGSFAYTPVAGTVLHAGNNQALSVSFTPSDTTDYVTASGSASINVVQATPTITWANPANIVYGTALGATQLDATANVSGSLTYSPAAGTVLHAANSQKLSVSFTPSDTTDYTTASGSASINVLQAAPTITWANPANIVYGTALGATQLDATSSVSGTFTYSPAAATVLHAGNSQKLSVSFTPSDATDYTTASATAAVNVLQATPTITWPNPANIVYGTALGSTQLDATAAWTVGGTSGSVAGTFTYTPAAGTVLNAGNDQKLSVSFAPSDTTDFTSVSGTAFINVLASGPVAINFSGTLASTPVVMNNVLYFAASSSAGMQLWSSNGTSSGTTMLTDVNPKYGGIDPADLTVVGNTLYFEADNGAAGPQLWSSNGTSSGTQMVTDVDAPIGLLPSYLTNVSGKLYFVGYNPTDAYQLYTSNGTASGTVMIADIDGTNGCNPSDLTAVGNLVYFSATDGVHGQQLWVSNGTSSATTMVDEIDGSVGSFPDELTADGSSVCFAAYDSVHGYQLWISNGTSSGTTMLTSANPSGGGLLPSNLTMAGSTLFFAGNDGTHGYQLWSSNGTASGTAMVADINGNAGADPSYLTSISGTVYFSANNGTDSYQLWSSNGTASGTAMVDDINGAAGSDPASLTVIGGMLYFSAYTSKTGFQVWQSNGSSSGTTMDSNLNAPTGCSPANLVPAGSTLYFTGTGASMWALATSSSDAAIVPDAQASPASTDSSIVLMGIVPEPTVTDSSSSKPGVRSV
jgi:ELWxxDGT repeat protein